MGVIKLMRARERRWKRKEQSRWLRRRQQKKNMAKEKKPPYLVLNLRDLLHGRHDDTRRFLQRGGEESAKERKGKEERTKEMKRDPFFFASLREGSAVKILTVDTDDAKRRNMREAAGEDMIDRLLESGEAERRRAR